MMTVIQEKGRTRTDFMYHRLQVEQRSQPSHLTSSQSLAVTGTVPRRVLTFPACGAQGRLEKQAVVAQVWDLRLAHLWQHFFALLEEPSLQCFKAWVARPARVENEAEVLCHPASCFVVHRCKAKSWHCTPPNQGLPRQ